MSDTWASPASSDFAPALPPSLHHFRVDRELARGGMGAVYLGHDTSLDRPVALKVILPGLAREQGFHDRFLREARAQAQITHSNVVQVFYVGEEAGTLYMAMELVDGGALDQVGKLSWEQALVHMRGLAEGLREAARLNIVHRDIKPSNVLLDRFGLAHLADFGLAAPVRSVDTSGGSGAVATVTTSGSLPSFTQVGQIMGSPPYMPPEQAKAQPLDTRADIYALGASFYELLTGKKPNEAGTLRELLAFFEGPAPTPVATKCPDVPRRFARVIDRCMERDLSRRFQTWDEVLLALDAAKPRPIVAAPMVTRGLAWLVDVAVFSAAARFTYDTFWPAGFLALAVWYLLGVLGLGATPGQWMMRLRLRRPPDLRPDLPRSVLRFGLQHGWLLAGSLLAFSIYQSAGATEVTALAIATALLALPTVPGALAFFFTRERQTLVDLLSGTRVLLDVR